MDALSIVSAFLMQIGVRHVSFDMTEAQRKLSQHPIIKAIVLFSIFFVTTRRVILAIAFTATYFLIMIVLLNEKNTFNVFSRPWLVQNGFLTDEYFANEEQHIISKYKKNVETLIYN